MNRRNFINNLGIGLMAGASFRSHGEVNTNLVPAAPIKSYRSNKSIFTNQELTKWCEKNGGHYAHDDELVYASYQTFFENKSDIIPNAYKTPNNSFRHTIFGIPSHSDKYEALSMWLIQFRHTHGQYKFIIKDIFYPDYTIENIKMMPLIASTREFPADKYYDLASPIFDIKTHRYVMYDGDCGTAIYIGFKFV